jgi:murein DD-endopeptidase MepM/ murein hydrolase activator NlpD
VPVSSVKQHRIATRAELRSVALSWPLSRVEVTSNFGQRGRQFHEGIDLRAPLGTPVYAAADGVVIYAGSRLRGYGNLVVIRHGQTGISTVYAHNSRLFVRRGQRVARGQKISLSGATGHVSGPHLHFEVRSGIAAVDPKQFLKHENDPDLTAVRIAQRRRMQYQSRRNLASQ